MTHNQHLDSNPTMWLSDIIWFNRIKFNSANNMFDWIESSLVWLKLNNKCRPTIKSYRFYLKLNQICLVTDNFINQLQLFILQSQTIST